MLIGIFSTSIVDLSERLLFKHPRRKHLFSNELIWLNKADLIMTKFEKLIIINFIYFRFNHSFFRTKDYHRQKIHSSFI